MASSCRSRALPSVALPQGCEVLRAPSGKQSRASSQEGKRNNPTAPSNLEGAARTANGSLPCAHTTACCMSAWAGHPTRHTAPGRCPDSNTETLFFCFFHFLSEGKASPPSKQRAPEDVGSCGMEIKIFLLASSLTHHVLRSVSSWPEVFSANAEVTRTQLWGSPGVPCSGGTAVLPPMGGSSGQICPQSPRLFPAAGLRVFCNMCGLDLAWDISGKVVSEFLSRKLSQSMLESLPEERQNAQTECHLGMATGFFLYLEGK